MPMPLVHAGVMYLHTFPDTVLALDASNGKVLWRHQYQPKGSPSSQKMGLALHGDKVFVPTSDLHVLALSAKTGELVWDHAIATPTAESKGAPTRPMAYQLRSPPLVVGDKVIQGVTASFVPKGGFAVAIDLASGQGGVAVQHHRPAGRAQRGQLERRAAREEERRLDLARAELRPRARPRLLRHRADLRHRSAAPSRCASIGVNANALYTNCTVAIRPKTGELAWYYQHVANDQWDLDWVFERTIVNVTDRTASPQGGDERRQDGHSRGARRRHRRVSVLGRRRNPERHHRDRPEDRRQDHRSRQAARSEAADRRLPERDRRAELAADVLQPEDAARVPAAHRVVHAPRARGVPTAHLRRRDLGRDSPRYRRRQARTPAGDRRREPEAGVDQRPDQRCRPPDAGDRGRCGLRRRPRSFAQGVRRHDRQATVVDQARQLCRARVSSPTRSRTSSTWRSSSA